MSDQHWLLTIDATGRVYPHLCGCAIGADHTDADMDEEVADG